MCDVIFAFALVALSLKQVMREEADLRLNRLKMEPERLAALKEGFNMLDRDRSVRPPDPSISFPTTV